MVAGSIPCDRSRPGKNNSRAAAQNISFAKRGLIFSLFSGLFFVAQTPQGYNTDAIFQQG
jgi:hypothetical protein